MENAEYRDKLIQRAKQFSLDVLRATRNVSRSDFSTQIMARQLIRSATSIGANIVEAQAASSRKDFTNFLRHALKSANETCYWLDLLSEVDRSRSAPWDALVTESTELSHLLGATIRSLVTKRNF